MSDPISPIHATGRRKTSTARVFLQPGSGEMTINKRVPDKYFAANSKWLVAIFQPLELLNVRDQFDILVTVSGGGNTGQAGAIRLGIARALDQYDMDANPSEELAQVEITEAQEGETVVVSDEVELTWHQKLRKAGYLTRDARSVLRKQVGLVKARKAKQFSKR